MDSKQIVEKCKEIYEDMDFSYISQWKEKNGGNAMGIMPIYFPKEVIHAAGVLPVELFGGGDMIDVVKGDSYYQSYICHIVRTMVDLGLSGKLDSLSGLICPFTCDVVRNFTGVWGLLFPEKYARFFDQPQNFDEEIGGEYLRAQLQDIIGFLETIGKKVTNESLNKSIELYNTNRALIRKLYDMRAEKPWQAKTDEVYLLLRAGGIMEVSEFNQMLIDYMDSVKDLDRKELDNIRVVISGAFCEQPPLTLIKIFEMAGCYVVDDDFLLGNRYLDKEVEVGDEPLKALCKAYLDSEVPSSCRFEEYSAKCEKLAKVVKNRNAEGIIFAAPSFCDPALEDQPDYHKEIEKDNVRSMSLQYSEDTRQFNLIREQIGTFSDAIKLSEA